MKCIDCVHWEADKECAGYDENYKWGECSGLGESGDVDIYAEGGMNGAYVKRIDTGALFFCAEFKDRKVK